MSASKQQVQRLGLNHPHNLHFGEFAVPKKLENIFIGLLALPLLSTCFFFLATLELF